MSPRTSVSTRTATLLASASPRRVLAASYEALWLLVLVHWVLMGRPLTRMAWAAVVWALEELAPEASDIPLSMEW